MCFAVHFGIVTMPFYMIQLGPAIFAGMVYLFNILNKLFIVFNSINSTFCKVLYIVIMYFFGFSIMSCVLCIFGLVHCFKTPYKVKIYFILLIN